MAESLEAHYYIVRSAIQNRGTGEVIIKEDYYSMDLDGDECLHGSFVPATRSYYEANGFTVMSCNQRAVGEKEYLLEMD